MHYFCLCNFKIVTEVFETLLDIAVMCTAIASIIVATIIVKRHPEAVEIDIFSPVEEAETPIAPLAYPSLAFERIFQREKDGKACLQLLLKNIGQSLTYEGIKLARKNELAIEYLPLDLRQDATKANTSDEYPTGTSLTFFLSGLHLDDAYYDMLIKYTDLKGNSYRQRVSGLGNSEPVVDPAKVLSVTK